MESKIKSCADAKKFLAKELVLLGEEMHQKASAEDKVKIAKAMSILTDAICKQY